MLAAAPLAIAAFTAPGADWHAPPPHLPPLPLGDWMSHQAPHPIPLLLPAADAAHSGKCRASALTTTSRTVSIRFASPDGVYFVNDTVRIRVDGTDGVHWIDRTVGSPPNFPDTRLELETGDIDRFAGFAESNAAHTPNQRFHANYTYTVQEGDASRDLDYKGTDSLYWGFGSNNIRSQNGASYNCLLPTPGADGSLGAQGNVSVVGVARPDVYVDAGTPGGEHTPGSLIRVAAHFGEPVVYSGAAPSLVLNASGTPRQAVFAGGNNTETLWFNYTVRGDDATGVLGYNGTGALSGAITNRTGHAVDLALPSVDTLAFLGGVALDTAGPRVEGVTAEGGLYGAGRAVEIDVGFDEAVVYTGAAPVLALDVGGFQRNATYERGNGTDTLTFAYTVLAGDRTGLLAYAETGALLADIADEHGFEAGLALPPRGGPGSLSGSGPVLLDSAAPPLVAAGSATDGGGNFSALGGAADADIIVANGSRYAVVAAATEDSGGGVLGAVQLIRVHENGTLEAEYEARDNAGGFGRLAYAYGIDAFHMGGAAYAIVAAHGDGAVQLIRIHGNNGTLSPAGSLDDTGGTGATGLQLAGATRVRAFEMGGSMHALVAGFSDHGVQLVNITGGGTLSPAGSLDDTGGDRELANAFDAAVFDLNGSMHAIVTGHTDDGVQLVRIHGDGGLSAADSLPDNATLALDGPRGVAVFDLGGAKHALVASEVDDGVQLIRIGADGTLAPAGSATDGERGFSTLDGAIGVAVLGDDGSGGVHAAVASQRDDGVQLVRVRSDGALLPAGSTTSGTRGFAVLDGAHGIASFDAWGAPHALVAVIDGGSVQLIRASTASVSGVTAPAGGTYGAGGTIDISVAFDGPVSVAEPIELRLNTGGAARYLGGNGTSTLVFRYAVAAGDGDTAALDYAGAYALRAGPGGSITENGTDVHASALLPPPGSGGSLGGRAIAVEIDREAPRIAGVTSPDANGTYGTGATVNITVRFTEPVSFDPPAARPEVPLDTGGGEGRRAVCAPGPGASDILACAYTVQPGDATADLDTPAGASLALGGAAARDAAGHGLASALLPGSPPGATLGGSKDIALDTAVPGVLRVTSPNASGTYGAGSEIRIEVVFDGDVSIDPEPLPGGASAPTLRLETGEDDRAALYAGGSGTGMLGFAYEVAAGDSSPDLDYTRAGALSLGGGELVDEYGNRGGDPALPEPGSAGSLGGQADIVIRAAPAAASAEAVFAGPRTVRIDYTAPLGPPAGHEGPVYGNVSIGAGGGGGASAEPASVSGLGTRTHTVRLEGDAAGASQNGTIRLLVGLEGAVNGALHRFDAGAIPVAPGESARTLSPPGATAPVAEIERDGFVRALNATGAGDGARPALNVTGLPIGDGAPAPGANVTARLPSDAPSYLIASFAEVRFPPNATVGGVPADGLLELYVSAPAPAARDVAGGFGIGEDGVLEVRRVVEVGDNRTRIEFSLPVRILLVGQAGGEAFYMAGGAVVPIAAGCAADGTAAEMHALMGGSGACSADSTDGRGKVIHTYHLTRFGTAELERGSTCDVRLSQPEIAFGRVEAGGRSAAAAQEVRAAGALPLASVSVSAGDWTGAGGAAVMPANATSVRAAGGDWAPLGGGAVGVPADEGGRSASVEFRLDVPQAAPHSGSGVSASQQVTYTVSCAPQG